MASKRKPKTKKSKAWQPPKNLIEAYVLNRECRDNPLFKLPEITPEFEEAYAFFDDLLQDRMNNKEYSVKDIAAKKGVTYEQVLEWATQNDIFAFGLDMIKMGCFANAEEAAIYNELEWEKAVRYCIENLDDEDERKASYVQELEKIEQENFEKSEKVYVMNNEVEPKESSTKLKLSSFTTKEQEQIEGFLRKEKDVETRFKFKCETTYNPETNVTTICVGREWGEDVTDAQKYYINQAVLCAATGSSSIEYADELIRQVSIATGKTNIDSNLVNANIKALLAMKPADEYEGMLISRLIVLHDQYMHFMAQSIHTKNIEHRERFINSATKLMRVYNETLEALNKHRRKGEQKVTVTHNHVNVNDGGKAIVGSEINQKTGEGDHDKK